MSAAERPAAEPVLVRGVLDVPVDFRAVFDALPTAYLLLTRDLRIADANTAYQRLVGLPVVDMLGRPVFEVFPPTPASLSTDTANAVRASFETARDTGLVDAMPFVNYDILNPATGRVEERHWSLISAPVPGPDGATQLILQRVEDVTDFVRERDGRQVEIDRTNEWRLRVEAFEAEMYAMTQELRLAHEARDVVATRLHSVSNLALALTAAETVEDLERIVVGRGLKILGADGGAICSPDGHGHWRVTINEALGEQVKLLYGNVPYDSPLPAAHVARTGERLLLPTQAAGLAFDASMAAVYADTKRLGWAFLPLAVRDECLGALAVAWAEEHPFGRDELALLDGFAAQCAQALERIRATAAQRELALAAQRLSETLQRSLLTQPPAPDALQISVRYQPAAQEAQVGGDWYDAFVTAAGATLLVVGDVQGHDRIAAAAMGQVRNILRGMAYDSADSPAILLSRLDAAMRGLELETLATAVLARVEQSPADLARGIRRLRWSNAGHLPPLLRQPDGRVQILGGENDLLLGFDPSTGRGERVVEFTVGSTLLLFTDGLVERRGGDLDEGIARLAAVLSSAGAQDPETLCDALLASIGTEGNTDDIALLVLRANAPSSENASVGGAAGLLTDTLTLSPDPRAVRAARHFTARLCAAIGLAEDIIDTAVLLTSEVVTNAVLHGRSQTRVVVTVQATGVLVEVFDDNSRPPVLQPRSDEALGGRGVTLLDAVASQWGVREEPVGKVVWFTIAADDEEST